MVFRWFLLGVLLIAANVAFAGCEDTRPDPHPTPTPRTWTNRTADTLPYREHGSRVAQYLLGHYEGWTISGRPDVDKPVEEPLPQGCVGAGPRLLHAAQDAYKVNEMVASTPPNTPLDPTKRRELLDLVDDMYYESRLAVDAHETGTSACTGSAPCADAYDDTWVNYVWFTYEVGEPSLKEVGWGHWVC
jgi:hypothetical protein